MNFKKIKRWISIKYKGRDESDLIFDEHSSEIKRTSTTLLRPILSRTFYRINDKTYSFFQSEVFTLF